MYVTRLLSAYQKDPSALSLPPPEGPNSGILVIQDEEAQPTCCFGLCNSYRLKDFPFPQNYNLKVEYRSGSGQNQSVSINRVVFIPALNQPLSSNHYYCLERKGKHKGEAYRSSTEDDMTTCCFSTIISDLKPETSDPQDIYQQFEIRRRDWGGFAAKSVAPDGFAPNFLRRKGWSVYTSTPLEFELTEAAGLDKILRARLPDFNFPLSRKNSPPVVVGKWYCPFMFIKEGSLEDQLDFSRYYEMTLEQQWEQIFTCGNNFNEENAVTVDVTLETETITISGKAAEKNVSHGFLGFKNLDNVGEEAGVGLSLAVVERMIWEQQRFGWIGVSQKEMKVKRVEEFGGQGVWKKFGCYVLVERFVLKRMNGSLVLTYSFRHTQHIRTKWE